MYIGTGQYLDGHMTTVFPAIMAATAYPTGDAKGELCAERTAHTPTGLFLPSVLESSTAFSMTSMSLSTSAYASSRTIPVLTVMDAA